MGRRMKVVAAAALLALLVAAAGALAVSRTDPGVSKGSILIGGTFPLSGVASLYGTIPKAETAYFTWFNKTSSVHGRKIKFKYVDDAYDPSQTVPLTRQLVERDHVFAIFNSLGTAPDLSTRPYLNQRHVPQVLLATGDSYWGTQYKKYPWTIGYNPDYPGEGAIYGRYIVAHLKTAKIGVLMQNDPFGKNYLAGLRKGLGSLKSHIVDVQPFDAGAPDVSQQIVHLKGSGATVFFVFGIPTPTITALITASKIGWHPTTFINNVSSSPAFMRIVASKSDASAVNGVISASYFKDPTDPAFAKDKGVRLYKQLMKKYYPKGDPFDLDNMYAFSAAWTMAYALQRAGNPPTRSGLMRALTNVNTSKNPFLLPGIKMKTTSSDHFLIEQWNLVKWQGDRWHRFGKLYANAR